MRRTIALLLLVSACKPPGTTAATDSALKACSDVTLGALRLACFDRVAANIGAKGSSAAAPNSVAPSPTMSGGWAVTEGKDPIDDSRTVVLSLPASEGVSQYGHAPELVLRCKSGVVDAYVNWGAYLGSDATAVVARIGDAAPERQVWSHSSDDRASFYPGDAAAFIRSLQGVPKFVAQITPYSASPITAVYTLAGIAAGSTKLFAACPGKAVN